MKIRRVVSNEVKVTDVDIFDVLISSLKSTAKIKVIKNKETSTVSFKCDGKIEFFGNRIMMQIQNLIELGETLIIKEISFDDENSAIKSSAFLVSSKYAQYVNFKHVLLDQVHELNMKTNNIKHEV